MDNDSPLGGLVSFGVITFFCWLCGKQGYEAGVQDTQQKVRDWELDNLRRKVEEMERERKV